jgi:hypothetical protein
MRTSNPVTAPPRPYAGITDPTKASRLLDLMIDAASANAKGFRSAPSGKHHKGHIATRLPAERLAATVYGE